ncbi:MAG: tRNA (adenosine(37)-N6)-threonylcarbamoyltransferase complex dimerization subunit type 1 TsaB [Paracoccaceae bacterium]
MDTSAAHCAAALLFGPVVPGSKEPLKILSRCEEMAVGQAERLPGLVQDLLREAQTDYADITLLAVGVGPGNFTGIRIAVAFVRGLALGLKVPATGVTSFEAVAMNAGSRPLPYWVTMQAPRGESYAQRFPQGAAQVLGPQALPALDAPVLRREDMGPDALVRAIAEHAFQAPRNPRARPAPFYLRGADAAPPSDPAPVILP